MIASMACFVSGDALVKLSGQSLPMSQVIFVRSVCGAILLLGLALALRAPHLGKTLSSGRVRARIVLDAGASIGFLTALVHLPLASATAINQATPLIITAIAMVVLKESVSARKWLAIVSGFAGVLLVVQPAGKDFNAWSLVVLASSFLTAARDVVTRTVDRRISGLQIVLASTVCLIPVSAAWGLADDWQPVTAMALLVLAGAALFVSAAYLLITFALREGAVAVVVPFRYTALIFAAILGWAVWGDLPDGFAWSGIALIVTTGIYLLRSR